jgi:hypothetical protein
MHMTITVNLTTDQDQVAKQDSAFYVGFSGPVAVVTDTTTSHVINVECVGEMRVILWQSEDCDPVEANIVAEIRTADDLERAGITSDEKLAEYEDRLEWENNSWFELFDSNDGGFHDFTEVYHTLDDAILAAVDTLLAASEQEGTVRVHANGVVELDPADVRATVCGTCGRAWDDSVSTAVTPTPAGRCPFEREHEEVSHDGTVDGAVCSDHPDILLSDGCYKCDPDDYVLIDGVYVNRLTLDDGVYVNRLTLDGSPVVEVYGRLLPGTYPWQEKSALDLWNDLCYAVGDDDYANEALNALADKLGINDEEVI